MNPIDGRNSPLGRTRCNYVRKAVCNCVDDEYQLKYAFRYIKYTYVYDHDRIISSDDRPLVIAGEGQHLQIYADSVTTINTLVATVLVQGGTFSSASACEPKRVAFYSAVDLEVNEMQYRQLVLDDPFNGDHPKLARDIAARAGLRPL